MTTLQIGMGWFPELPGGLDRVYYNLVRALTMLGVDVRGIVAGSQDVVRSSCGRVAAFGGTEIPLVRRLALARGAVRQHIAACRPDIVGAHFALFTLPALDVMRHLPLVVHFHGPWAQELKAEGRAGSRTTRMKFATGHVIEQLVYRRALRCIVLSKAFGELLERDYGVPAERIRVVPGGVETDRFTTAATKQEARRELGLDPHRPVIVVVRRLARRMGLDNLLSAMAEVRRRVPDVLLLIAGKGPMRDELQQQIEQMALTGNVALLGFVPDDRLPLLYRSAEFSVVPTASLEGFGLITLESLAAGTPVLVTPVGGLPEAVESLSRELILASAAPAELAIGIENALLGQKSLPTSEACRNYVTANFTWGICAQRTCDVYREVLA
jgi:glycosyltransferase involved in cell wall biosynthesis